MVKGQVYKMYQTNLSLNQALKLVGELGSEKHVLIQNDEITGWTVYWLAKKGAVQSTLTKPQADF
ncbi:MAG: hypothetical protein ACTSV2_14630 [Candidatus Thorarchaeota archaeon]